MKKVLFVIANNGFQDYEFATPYEYMLKNEIAITIAAGKTGECIWVFGTKTHADVEIHDVKPKDYDMIIFIWWGGAYTQYFRDEEYLKLGREAKKIGAICIAPMILADAGILYGKKVTGRDQWKVQKNYIKKNWWIFVQEQVVVCDNIVTADGPDAASLFAMKCLDLLLAD